MLWRVCVCVCLLACLLVCNVGATTGFKDVSGAGIKRTLFFFPMYFIIKKKVLYPDLETFSRDFFAQKVSGWGNNMEHTPPRNVFLSRLRISVANIS